MASYNITWTGGMKMILDKTINGNKLEEIITANFTANSTAKEKGHVQYF